MLWYQCSLREERKSITLHLHRQPRRRRLQRFCSFPPFVNLSMTTTSKQTNFESLPRQLLLFIGSWYMNKRLSWLKKATAEALLNLRTFVTNGVSSLTLSCLTKTNPHSKQHPSVLDENNDGLLFRLHSKHLDLPRPPSLFFSSEQPEKQLGNGNLQVNQLFVRSHGNAPYPTICELCSFAMLILPQAKKADLLIW